MSSQRISHLSERPKGGGRVSALTDEKVELETAVSEGTVECDGRQMLASSNHGIFRRHGQIYYLCFVYYKMVNQDPKYRLSFSQC